MGKSQRDEIENINGHQDDPFLHLSTVADALGRSPQTIGRWVQEGVLPSVFQPNGLRKIRKSELLKWLDVTQFGETDEEKELVAFRVSELN